MISLRVLGQKDRQGWKDHPLEIFVNDQITAAIASFGLALVARSLGRALVQN